MLFRSEEELKEAKTEDNKVTNIYQEDEDSNIVQEKVFNIIEIEELGLVGLSSPEVSELKELRKSLNDMCYQIFDIIDSPNFTISENHKKELKDFIDDALLWICSIEKPTKIDYKQKIDEINDEEVYPKGAPEGWGCPAVSNHTFTEIDKRLKKEKNNTLLWLIN